MIKRPDQKTILLYGGGQFGWSMIDRVLVTWLYAFYITGIQDGSGALMAPLVFGTVFFLGRVVDAVADPIIARYSDNLEGKWGRRIPFLAVSGILYAAVFIALFYPVVQQESIWNSIYLAVMLGLYFLLFTAYVCPYLALLPELGRNTTDRVNLSTSKAIFGLIGGGLGMVGAGLAIGWFGFHGMIWFMGIFGLLFLYLPVLIREKDYTGAKPATMGVLEAVVNTIKNRAFLIYLAGNIAFWFGFNIITINLPLYVTQLLGRPEEATSEYFLALVPAVGFFFLVKYMISRIGLKKMMLLSMFIFVVTLPFIYVVGMPLFGLSPDVIWFMVIGIASFSVAGLMIIPDALVAAVSDLEEKLTGQRREAMYFGTQGFFMKLNLGFSTVVSSALLQFFGMPLGVQLTGPVAALFILIGLLIFTRYPEDMVIAAQREAQVRAGLS